MEITIDNKSGFCFGVLKAIETAERLLQKYDYLFCLGDIVHNDQEVIRLRSLGLIVINHGDLKTLFNTRVLIRAHGEHPSTYQIAQQNNIELIDATCPVVIKLQNRVGKSQVIMDQNNGQVVIFGKQGHAEVVGLLGQTKEKAIVVGNDLANLDEIDFSRPVHLYSQTTQDKETYSRLIQAIMERIPADRCGLPHSDGFQSFNTICGQVSNRGPHLAGFARQHEIVVFVSGKKSSNGKYLYGKCKENNTRTYFVSEISDLKPHWFDKVSDVGICGATSTPMWLMEKVADWVKYLDSTCSQIQR